MWRDINQDCRIKNSGSIAFGFLFCLLLWSIQQRHRLLLPREGPARMAHHSCPESGVYGSVSLSFVRHDTKNTLFARSGCKRGERYCATAIIVQGEPGNIRKKETVKKRKTYERGHLHPDPIAISEQKFPQKSVKQMALHHQSTSEYQK